MPRDLPVGTVTFLFTDIEGSTRVLHEHGARYAELLGEHRRVLREAFARRGGVEVDTQGDAFFVAFARASDAVAAASDGQAALREGPISVRMGLHTGEPVATEEGYVGIDVHRAARIAAAGHGGQVLLSQATCDLVAGETVRDLGEHRLKDLSAPERPFQLGDADFPRRGSQDGEDGEARGLRIRFDVRSGRRGEPASDRLAGMTKSPAAAALDSIVAGVLAPDLKSMGFRKKSRHWSHEAGETHRGVTVQSSQFNVTSDSRFTVDIGASFVALGHPVPNAPGAWGTAVSRRLSGLRSEPIDEWFAFDALDEATIERAGADLDRAWAQLGRPFLTALQSPQALCDFVCDTGSVELALEVLDRVAIPLEDEARQSQLARIAADRAAAREGWRHLPDDPHPLELGIGIWAEVVRQFHRLGLQLGDEHRRSATAVLADAKSGMLTTRFHSERDEVDAQELEAALRD